VSKNALKKKTLKQKRKRLGNGAKLNEERKKKTEPKRKSARKSDEPSGSVCVPNMTKKERRKDTNGGDGKTPNEIAI
jgi:hypothetical protein